MSDRGATRPEAAVASGSAGGIEKEWTMRRTMIVRAAALGLLAATCVASATASASAGTQRRAAPELTLPRHADGLSRALANGRLSAAREALLRAEALFHPALIAARYGAVTRPGQHDATLILRDLAARIRDLSPADQAAARGVLGRPSDGGADPLGNGWSVAEAAGSPACGAHVCVHWVATTADAPAAADTTPANGIPDWVDSTLATVEHVWDVEVTTMGYQAPLDDSASANDGGSPALDVYISNLGSQQLYGYCTTDDPDVVDPNSTYQFYDVSAYCVVDNNYAEPIFGSHTPLQNLQVTTAHEFFHAVQAAYDFFDDTWLLEGTATWMEDEVYDSINDNRQYLVDSQLHQPGVSLDKGSSCCFQYGEWIWWRYLSESLADPTIIRDVWERADGSGSTKGDMATGPDNYSLQAARNALAARGDKLRTAYGDFAVWNRIPAQRYSEGAAYPVAPSSGSFALGTSHRTTGWLTVKLKHLTSVYATLVPGTSASTTGHVTVQVDGPTLGWGPEARLIVTTKAGAATMKRFTLSTTGIGQLRVAFGRGAIKSVVVVMSNASQRYTCWTGTALSCQGSPLDDGRSYAFRATIS
jgi:hypothetical protein